MTTPSFLDDDQIQRLADLLEQRAVPFRGFNLEALDGFLSALAVGPDIPPASEWEPEVWGGKPPRWDGDDEALAVQALLLGHWNMVTARVRNGEDDLPDHLAPLLWLPEAPKDGDDEAAEGEGDEGEETPDPNSLDIGRDWAVGFFSGAALREAQWDQWLDAEPWIEEIFALLEELASGEINPEDPKGKPRPITYEERLETIGAIPGMLADLHHHRIDSLTPREPIRREAAPGRNDPCPCGSGRKFKKCCGAGD